MAKIREVWADNAERELSTVTRFANTFYSSYVCMDTEFPGFIHRTPLGGSLEQRYQDMKRNVDMMKLVQLGFTFYSSNGQSVGHSWQVNFRDFDPAVDPHAESSIRLLKDSGIDFERNRREGVDAESFGDLLFRKLIIPCYANGTKWIMFHGLYDLGYIVKLLLRLPLPDTLPEFMSQARRLLLGRVYDLKHMAKFCGFDQKLGLLKIAKELGVDPEGHHHHQAGYDSLLIGSVFWKIKEKFAMCEDDFMGVIHGAETSSFVPMHQYYHPVLLAAPMPSIPAGYWQPTFTPLQRGHGCFYGSWPHWY